VCGRFARGNGAWLRQPSKLGATILEYRSGQYRHNRATDPVERPKAPALDKDLLSAAMLTR